jgi:hypothetical protein
MARSYIEDTLSHIPTQTGSVICGDWNTRVGELSPTIEDITIPRKSMDKHENSRATWVISTCEQWGWHILNGIQPGPPAQYTFKRGNDRSCIDLLLSNNAR